MLRVISRNGSIGSVGCESTAILVLTEQAYSPQREFRFFTEFLMENSVNTYVEAG
jgi:hypothetical protein